MQTIRKTKQSAMDLITLWISSFCTVSGILVFSPFVALKSGTSLHHHWIFSYLMRIEFKNKKKPFLSFAFFVGIFNYEFSYSISHNLAKKHKLADNWVLGQYRFGDHQLFILSSIRIKINERSTQNVSLRFLK